MFVGYVRSEKPAAARNRTQDPLAWSCRWSDHWTMTTNPYITSLVTKNVFISAMAKRSKCWERWCQSVQAKEGGGLKPLQILSSCSIMCTSQKDIQNSEDKWGKKKQLSGYKQCHTYKNQSLEVSKYMQSHSQTWAGGLRTQSLAILEAKPPPHFSCYT